MPRWRRRLFAAIGGLASGAAVGGWAGLICALGVALVLANLLGRVEPVARRRERARAITQLPLAADLLAAALRTGAPPDRAALIVGEALGGPVGARLVRVARELRVGGPAARAWAHLDDLPAADRVSRAAIRSAERGTALTPALERVAEELRAARAAAAEEAARRVGVLAVLPLGLCFLPAFLLAGVVPVIAAVLGDVLTTR